MKVNEKKLVRIGLVNAGVGLVFMTIGLFVVARDVDILRDTHNRNVDKANKNMADLKAYLDKMSETINKKADKEV